MARLVLRHFLYLDQDLLDEFLGQLEGGLFDEEHERAEESTSKSRSVGGEAKVVRGNLGRSNDSGASTERIVRQTASSKFDRFRRQLLDHEALQELGALDDAIWDQLEAGELLEIEAKLSQPGLSQVTQLARQLADVAPLLQAIGAELKEEDVSQAEALASLADTDRVPVLVEVAAVPRYRFACRLRGSSLTVGESDLVGEATVLAKLQRKLKKGEREDLVDLPGVAMLPRAKRRELEAAIKKSKSPISQGATSIGHPGGVLTAVAINR